MRAGASVRMIFPGDTTATMVPTNLAARASKEAGARVYRPALSTGQRAVKYFADAAPSLGGFAGGLAGGSADLGAGAMLAAPTGGASLAASYAAAVPAIAGGSAVGGALGAAAQMAAYKMAGIPFDDSPAGIAGNVVGHGAYEGGMGALTGGTNALMVKAAPAAFKAALGNAKPGMEEAGIKSGAPVSASGRNSIATAISSANQFVTKAVSRATKRGMVFSWDELGSKLGLAKGRAARADVVSNVQEEALSKALGVLKTKYGPNEATSVIVAPMRGGLRASAPIVTKTPATPITPDALHEITGFARDEVKKLVAARSVPGSTATPSLDELAYGKIYDAGREMLGKIHGVRAANMFQSKMLELDKAYADALKRAPSRGMDVMSGIAGGSAAGWMTHDPRFALLGLPVGAIAHMAQTPEAQSKLALALANPRARAMVSNIPRGLSAVPQAAGWFGAPGQPSDEQLINKAGRK